MALKKKEFICVGVPYQKDGEEKMKWNRVGEIVTLDGQNGGEFQIVEIYSMPGAKLRVFEDKPKNDSDF